MTANEIMFKNLKGEIAVTKLEWFIDLISIWCDHVSEWVSNLMDKNANQSKFPRPVESKRDLVEAFQTVSII